MATLPCANRSSVWALESLRWRRGWDSNPRHACARGSFQDYCLRPLGHLSYRHRRGHFTTSAPSFRHSCHKTLDMSRQKRHIPRHDLIHSRGERHACFATTSTFLYASCGGAAVWVRCHPRPLSSSRRPRPNMPAARLGTGHATI